MKTSTLNFIHFRKIYDSMMYNYEIKDRSGIFNIQQVVMCYFKYPKICFSTVPVKSFKTEHLNNYGTSIPITCKNIINFAMAKRNK